MFYRSINRFNSLAYSLPQPIITNSGGEFLVKYSIGTPPVEVMGLLDTGSDLIWLQCEPCISCYYQYSPIFDPFRSDTYKDIPCPSDECREVLGSTTCKSSSCEYGIIYENNGYSKGNIALETISLRTSGSGQVKFSNLLIGCGYENKGPFSPDFSGVIGMGLGSTSLISQIRVSVDDKFSYCLSLTQTSTSKLNFGANAIVSGLGVVTTPLAFGPAPTFYYVTLEGVTIGAKKMEYFITKEKNSTVDDEGNLKGNMIIDSGTALSFIPRKLFDEIQSTLTLILKLNPVRDPLNLGRLCYNTPSSHILQKPNATLYFTLHFAGRADVLLHDPNVFYRMSPTMLCLAFAPTDADTAVLGNIVQNNFLIGFDMNKRTVSFRGVNCNTY
ncbi:hypothetical protein Lal_00005859 [Lupinus albus]|nr:hypothetical protein Lal_00005859 [Lupinus albus]